MADSCKPSDFNVVARLIMLQQEQRLLLDGFDFETSTCPKARSRRPTPRQQDEWSMVAGAAAVAEQRIAAKYGPIVTAYRRALKRAKRIHRRPAIRPFVERARSNLKPVYRKIILDAIEQTVSLRSKAGRRSVRLESGPYRYGRLDSSGNINLDVDAMVNDRLGHLADSISDFDTSLARRIERAGGWDIDELEDLIDEYEESLGVKADQVLATESWGAVGTGRAGGLVQAGVDSIEWMTAMDERVRETHQVYGSAGPRRLGFNFAKLVGMGKRYLLRWPYDEECTERGEIILCRCIAL